MMDIDHFKLFNDTWGHQAGDEALRHVVMIISSMLRKNDFLGRYGGEEFVFFFSRADKKTGIAIAERVREAIASTAVKISAGLVPISASFGVVLTEDVDIPDVIQSPAAGGTNSPEGSGKEENASIFEHLLHCADLALYRAKEGGRNRVICFEKEEEIEKEKVPSGT
jgi:PleD family two-component response regulator